MIKNNLPVWPMAKARKGFEELVRAAQIEGPQRIGNVAVVVPAKDFEKMARPRRTGKDLIAALQSIPEGDVEF